MRTYARKYVVRSWTVACIPARTFVIGVVVEGVQMFPLTNCTVTVVMLLFILRYTAVLNRPSVLKSAYGGTIVHMRSYTTAIARRNVRPVQSWLKNDATVVRLLAMLFPASKKMFHVAKSAKRSFHVATNVLKHAMLGHVSRKVSNVPRSVPNHDQTAAMVVVKSVTQDPANPLKSAA